MIFKFLVLFFFGYLCLGCAKEYDPSYYLSDDSFITLPLETVFEFNESENIALGYISSVKSDDYGNILVHDFRQPYLLLFNQKGKFLNRIGNEGRGPGEFQQISSFIVDQDRLWVIESNNAKMEKFEYQNGEYIHSETITLESNELTGGLIGKTDEGIFINSRITFMAGSRNNPTKRPIALINEKGEIIIDSVFSLPVTEQMSLQASGNKLEGDMIFGNKSLIAFDGINRIYTLWTDSVSIDAYTSEGSRQHVFSHHLQPVKITDHEKDSISDMYHIYRADLRRKLPDVKPIVYDIIVDDNQRIWMELFTKELGNKWFCFTKEGKPLYKVNIPKPGAKFQEISGNRVIWSYLNEDGAPTIVVSKIDSTEW